MKRKIITIDEARCNGCGLCVAACHEHAIGLLDGKARLLRDDYCDGLGDCLPACPTGAITFEVRDAEAYDEAAVREAAGLPSRSAFWPIQIKLVNEHASYLNGSSLLIAADCTAFSYPGFQSLMVASRVLLIGCPKLDSIDYSQKLLRIFSDNEIQDVTIVRMTVPCCFGLEHAVRKAIQESGKEIPCHVLVISPQGQVVSTDPA